jgi:hypothetical protein
MNDAPIPLSYQSPAQAPLEGWGIVRWWETRRLIYNGAVLVSWSDGYRCDVGGCCVVRP